MNKVLLPLSVLLLGAAPFTCSPLESKWGLEAIGSMQTPADPALTCDVPVPADPHAAERAACAFAQGDHPSATLGVAAATAARFPVRHLVIVMKENRSFDHLFGALHDEGQPDAEAEPASYVNPDAQGSLVAPFHEPTTCVNHDPGHQARSVAVELAGGQMDGFVLSAAQSTGTDGHFVLGRYEQGDLPFNFWLANEFALADRQFAPMATGTFGNRNFMLFGTNAGVVDTGVTFPDPATPSVMQTLMNAGFTWGAYSDSEPFSGTLGWTATNPGVHSFQAFLDALDQGTLPNVAFVDAVESVTDDHPVADLQAGEAWLRQLYLHAAASPQWSRLAIVWTYDEAGGFADHVPPPVGCQAAPTIAPTTQMGPRVPLVVVSRWAKRHYVSHVPRDHTAITRLIETLFDLPALTARDANSDALLDLFDFSCAQAPDAPAGAPDAGTGGCVDAGP